MQEQRQGETYEEVSDEATEQASTSEEGQESTKSNPGTLFGLPIKYVAIGAAVIVVLLIGVFVFTTRKSDDDNGDDIVEPGSEDSMISGDYSELSVYDESGNRIGFCYGTDEGETIINDAYTVIGYISSSGSTPFYSEGGEQLGTYSPEDEYNAPPQDDSGIITGGDIPQDDTSSSDTAVSDVPSGSSDEPLSVESDDTKVDTDVNLNGESDVNVEELIQSTERNKLLRQYGYTGDEIDIANDLNISTADMVQSARKLHDKAAAESMIRMSKKSSKEFRTIKDNSIFCMGKITFEVADVTKDDAQQYTGSYVVNADYSKCPTYGHQLFIKCKIANSFYAFMIVTPSRWETLPDNGNIVVRVDYQVTGNKHANMYITDITEVDTTELTVNPQDSGVNINDILEGNVQYKGAVAEEEGDITEGDLAW